MGNYSDERKKQLQKMYNSEKKTESIKLEFTWNFIGSVTYAASSFIYLLIVTRCLGAYDAGIFSIAFSNAQLMLTIGRYGMRAFQSTDIRGQYTFGTYLASRILSCIGMFLTNFVYIVINNFSPYKSQIVFWVCVLKMVDAVEDIFHGLLQLNKRLDIAGKLQTVRNAFSMALFLIIILITGQLLYSCILTSIFSLIACLGINIPISGKYDKIKPVFTIQPLRRLMIACFPLFAASFLSLYIYNAPKYAIDIFLNEELQAFYGILFMPAFIINLFSEFVFKPLLVRIADLWVNSKIRELINSIMKLVGWILLLTIITLIGGYVLGIPVLSLIYGINLSNYKKEFIILLLGGGFGASVWLFNNILTAMRKQVGLLIGYLAVSIITSIISPFFVKTWHITGASLSYLCTILILFLILTMMLIYYIKENRVRDSK